MADVQPYLVERHPDYAAGHIDQRNPDSSEVRWYGKGA